MNLEFLTLLLSTMRKDIEQVVYCLKDVDFAGPSHGMPEILSMALVTVLHFWRKNTLLSIAAGTICYMVLAQFVFM